MKGYLIYNSIDIIRNKSYIDWIIDEGSNLNIDITLFTNKENFSVLDYPDFVINRSRDSFVSKFFEEKSIPVFNDYKTTFITNDKLKTYDYLKENIPMLDTFKLIDKPDFYPCVIKSRHGHGGNEVFLINKENEYLNLNIDNNYIYQRLADDLGKDLRVYIIGNKIITSILRTNDKSFKSNYSLGGNISLYTLSDKEKDLIYQIITHFNFGLVGIDFLFDENNNLVLNEIEDAVGSRMVSKLTDINIVKLYLEFIIDKIN